MKNSRGADIQNRTFDFACEIVLLFDELAKRGASARQLGSQLLRSGTSIGANVEEGDAAQSRADFISKLEIGLKEARESHYWLRLLAKTKKLREPEAPLIDEANSIVSILTAIVRNTKANRPVKETKGARS